MSLTTLMPWINHFSPCLVSISWHFFLKHFFHQNRQELDLPVLVTELNIQYQSGLKNIKSVNSSTFSCLNQTFLFLNWKLFPPPIHFFLQKAPSMHDSTYSGIAGVVKHAHKVDVIKKLEKHNFSLFIQQFLYLMVCSKPFSWLFLFILLN